MEFPWELAGMRWIRLKEIRECRELSSGNWGYSQIFRVYSQKKKKKTPCRILGSGMDFLEFRGNGRFRYPGMLPWDSPGIQGSFPGNCWLEFPEYPKPRECGSLGRAGMSREFPGNAPGIPGKRWERSGSAFPELHPKVFLGFRGICSS